MDVVDGTTRVLHLDGASGAQVGLEDILQALTCADVDLESFAPPL
jgi:hypothetical protein